MSNKNPFEIRLEVLKMAQELAEKNFSEANELAYEVLTHVKDYQHKTAEEIKQLYQEIKPSLYTPEDIKNIATELYEFVCCKAEK